MKTLYQLGFVFALMTILAMSGCDSKSASNSKSASTAKATNNASAPPADNSTAAAVASSDNANSAGAGSAAINQVIGSPEESVAGKTPDAALSATAKLANKKTFVIFQPSAASARLFPNDSAAIRDTTALAVQSALMSRGYVYQAQPPADFVVNIGWQTAERVAPGSSPPQVNQPLDINVKTYVTFSVEARDGTTREIIWRGPPVAPIEVTTITRAGVADIARQVTKSFPAYSTAVAHN